ncbi:hypothetical protein SDC9_154206 [bioreactor metagenome]|uniref:Uncharacterized protein n=1 Tax=bioreactor metagenome TaxID=1076179 RepID=A0A645F0I8_9ZZZZ
MGVTAAGGQCQHRFGTLEHLGRSSAAEEIEIDSAHDRNPFVISPIRLLDRQNLVFVRVSGIEFADLDNIFDQAAVEDVAAGVKDGRTARAVNDFDDFPVPRDNQIPHLVRTQHRLLLKSPVVIHDAGSHPVELQTASVMLQQTLADFIDHGFDQRMIIVDHEAQIIVTEHPYRVFQHAAGTVGDDLHAGGEPDPA